MGTIGGSSSIDIDAPIQRCYDLVADPEGTAEWQESLKRAEVLERDPDGNPTLVETFIDAKAREVRVVLRFDWDEPTELRWTRADGDLKRCDGAWTFEDLGDDRTRATYTLELDPGRMLSMLAKGPLGDQLRKMLTDQPPKGLKAYAESVA